MGKTREVKKRIKAVGNIRRITKTMQMIATSKFSKAQATAAATKPYSATIFDLVSELAATVTDVSHPLLDSGKPRTGKDLTLIITSDRGLCGPYNGAVLRLAMLTLRETPSAKQGEIELVGRKGAGFLKFSGVAVSKQHNQFGDKPSYDNVRALGETYINRFISGELATVRVVYTKFLSAGRQVPTVLQLLPFQKPEPKAEAKPASGERLVYEFTPDAASLLGDLLPAAVKSLLFQAFNDSVVSEHVARMIAMKSATDNAGKAVKGLTREYNRARQSQITTELTEIISGAAALG